MTPPYRCWAEVDLAALRENLAWIRHHVGPEVKILTVVKADAYGHGLKSIAAALMQSGTDLFGVANLAEARSILSVGRGWPILMLGPCLPDEVDSAVRDDVMPTISSLVEAKQFSAAARRLKRPVGVHVKVDTGMGRLGVRPEAAAALVREVSRLPGLRLAGLYTHFASVEDDADLTRQQLAAFRRVLDELNRAGLQPPLVHACNSGGLLCESDAAFNTVRPGLLVYGVFPPGQRAVRAALQRRLRPALTWKCRVGFVKEVPPGTALSYGHTFTAPRRMKIATLTAGYGDGFVRAASNRAEVLIGGRRCRVVGRVTMDQMLADVSSVPRVKPGDEVVLIGGQGRERIDVNELAAWFGTVPWEVLTGITYRVPRVYHGVAAA
jgi:alanine racemase